MEDNRDLFPTKDDLANYGYVLWNALREIFNSRYGTVYGLANIAEDALMEFRVKSQMHGKEYVENTIRYPDHVCCKDAFDEGLTTSFVLKRKKVYCSDCEFALKPAVDSYSGVECEHPKNIYKEVVENWFHKYTQKKYGALPGKINKNNNCSWFTVKLDGRN